MQAARGAFGTGLCWYHLELEAEEEATLGAAITPSQGLRAGHQRDAAPARPLQGRPPRAHSNCQTGTAADNAELDKAFMHLATAVAFPFEGLNSQDERMI